MKLGRNGLHTCKISTYWEHYLIQKEFVLHTIHLVIKLFNSQKIGLEFNKQNLTQTSLLYTWPTPTVPPKHINTIQYMTFTTTVTKNNAMYKSKYWTMIPFSCANTIVSTLASCPTKSILKYFFNYKSRLYHYFIIKNFKNINKK